MVLLMKLSVHLGQTDMIHTEKPPRTQTAYSYIKQIQSLVQIIVSARNERISHDTQNHNDRNKINLRPYTTSSVHLPVLGT